MLVFVFGSQVRPAFVLLMPWICCRLVPKRSARQTQLLAFDAAARSAPSERNRTAWSAPCRATPTLLCGRRNDTRPKRLNAAPPVARARTTDFFIERASALTFDLSGPPKAGPLEGRVRRRVSHGQALQSELQAAPEPPQAQAAAWLVRSRTWLTFRLRTHSQDTRHTPHSQLLRFHE